MNEIIILRALFFVVLILLAVFIIVVTKLVSAIAARLRSMRVHLKKAEHLRKREPASAVNLDRENPFPKSSTLTIDNCWCHRI